MGNEKRDMQTDEPVFTTAQLVWLDEETGDVFEIEVVGAGPWVAELKEQGFEPQEGSDTSTRRYRCRIEFAPDPH